jgi:hypothetical protein
VARWADLESEAPELAERARGLLEARVHKTIATLRRDGSPRISGIEAFIVDGDLWFGAMWRSLKALDLRRDPRFALHSGTIDPPEWAADAKLSGTTVEIDDETIRAEVFGQRGPEPPEGPAHLFRADIRDVSVVGLGDPPDHLVTELWLPGQPARSSIRR